MREGRGNLPLAETRTERSDLMVGPLAVFTGSCAPHRSNSETHVCIDTFVVTSWSGSARMADR